MAYASIVFPECSYSACGAPMPCGAGSSIFSLEDQSFYKFKNVRKFENSKKQKKRNFLKMEISQIVKNQSFQNNFKKYKFNYCFVHLAVWDLGSSTKHMPL